MTEPEPLQQVNRTYVRFKGRALSYFAGCDYFRLSSHPEVLRALNLAASRYGLNVAASRLTTGNHELYARLEKALAAFFASEMAFLVPTGYLTNLVVAQALSRSFSHVLLDERSHPTLLDAATFFECPVLRFKHREPAQARLAAERCGPGAKLILLTDGLFSHDGSVAPLKEYRRLLPHETVFLVDDAHGAGVVGQKGRGTPELAGVGRDRLIQTITLSKALGSYGGAIVGTERLRQKVMDRSRIFVGSTPLPLPLVNAGLQALTILRRNRGKLQSQLAENAEFVKSRVRAAGWPVPDHPGPIVSVVPKNVQSAETLKRSLLSAGVFPSFIKYPGGAKGGYFRFVISSEHTPRQLRSLIEGLAAAH